MKRILNAAIDVLCSTTFSVGICIAALVWTFFGAETTADRLIGLLGFFLSGCWMGVTVLVNGVIGVAKDGAAIIAEVSAEQDHANS